VWNICVITEESFACCCFTDIAPFNNISSSHLVTYRMQQERLTPMLPTVRYRTHLRQLNSADGCHITAEHLLGGSFSIMVFIAIILPSVRPTSLLQIAWFHKTLFRYCTDHESICWLVHDFTIFFPTVMNLVSGFESLLLSHIFHVHYPCCLAKQ